MKVFFHVILRGENGVHDRFHCSLDKGFSTVDSSESIHAFYLVLFCSLKLADTRWSVHVQPLQGQKKRKKETPISVAEHFLPLFFCVCEHGLIQGDVWVAGCLLTIRVPALLRCPSVSTPNCNLPLFFFLPFFVLCSLQHDFGPIFLCHMGACSYASARSRGRCKRIHPIQQQILCHHL